MQDFTPLISVIVPIRNEEHYIQKCLNSILNQTLGSEHYEILVVDGMSRDQSRQLVTNLAQAHRQICLLDNPHQTAPYAMNIGLRHAKGQYIVRVDGHCEIESDYLQQCLSVLQETAAGCVGGSLKNVGTNYWSRAIALGMSSPFGVGNALFRYSSQAIEVDTLAFGMYLREVVECVGSFNEELTRNQDDEYNYRVRQAGYKIWMDPRIRSNYYTRGDLKSLWRQYFQYGFWKIKVLELHPGSLKLRHLVPGIFVSSLLLMMGLSLFLQTAFYLFLILTPYLLLDLCFALYQSRKNPPYFPALIVIFPTLHIAYGSGFLNALLKKYLLRASHARKSS